MPIILSTYRLKEDLDPNDLKHGRFRRSYLNIWYHYTNNNAVPFVNEVLPIKSERVTSSYSLTQSNLTKWRYQKKRNSAPTLSKVDFGVVEYYCGRFVETLDFRGSGRRGNRVSSGPCRRLLIYPVSAWGARFRVASAGYGSAKREQDRARCLWRYCSWWPVIIILQAHVYK